MYRRAVFSSGRESDKVAILVERERERRHVFSRSINVWSRVHAGSQAAPSPAIPELPSVLHLRILSFLPLVERVRSALVARSWAAQLADTAFWAELRFDGASCGSVDDAALLRLCQRAGPSLRTLDVGDGSCDEVTPAGVITALVSDGVGRALVALRTWAPGVESVALLFFDAAEIATLLAACPALASAEMCVRGNFAEVSEVLRALPRHGLKGVEIMGGNFNNSGLTWAHLTEWLPTALAASHISDLSLSYADTAAGTEQGAARVAEALAAPGRGVRLLKLEGRRRIGETPLPGCLFRALTAESPLEELSLVDSGLSGEAAADLAAALAPAAPVCWYSTSRATTSPGARTHVLLLRRRRTEACLGRDFAHCPVTLSPVCWFLLAGGQFSPHWAPTRPSRSSKSRTSAWAMAQRLPLRSQRRFAATPP